MDALSRRAARSLALSALFVCAVAAPVSASVTIRAAIGYGETFVPGAWTPLTVTVENVPNPSDPTDRPRDYRGELRVVVGGLDGGVAQYVQPMTLASPSRKSVRFSVMIPRGGSIRIELDDERRGVVAWRDIPLVESMLNDREDVLVRPFVLLLSDAAEDATYPTWVSPAARIKRIGLTELPHDYKGLDWVRVVVARRQLSTDPAIHVDQLEALKTWIELGGRLVVVTPRNYAELKRDRWLAELLPAPIDSVRDITLADLEPGAGTERMLLTTWGEPRADARVVWDSPLGPLALERPIGGGKVLALALETSMSQSSLDSTAVGRRMRALLETPLLGPSREDLRVRHNWSSADIDPETAVPNILLLPNIWIVTLLLGAFVVIVGPVNFYLLRRRRRLEMAWFTIPALSMGFFVAVYGYGMATKGGDQAYASAEILHLISGESRGLLLWNSMQFSPRRTTYAFDSPPGGTSMPLLTYFHGPNASLLPGGRGAVTAQLAPGETTRASRLLPDAAHGYRLFQPGEQWKMHFYQGERTMRIEGSIRGKATIAGGGSSLELDVTNDTAATLEDARFYLGEEEYRLGRIEPGERLRHEFVGANRRLDRGEPEKPVDRFVELAHQRIRDGARGAYPIFPVQLPQRRCRLVAVQEVWGSEVELSPDPDHYKQCRLVEVELPLELLGAATLQTQTILRRDLYNMEPDGGLSPNGDYVNLNQSLADVAISPPLLEGPVRFESGRIEIDYSARGIEYFEASAFNYATGRWETFHRSLSGSRNSPPGGRLGESESIAQRRTNPFGGISQGEASRVKAEVRRDWINPSEPLLRLRLEARRINDPSLGARVGLNGVDVHRVDAALTLSPEAAPRPRGEDRR